MAGLVRFDDSQWPRVMITWPGEQLSDEDFAVGIAKISAYSHRRQPYVIVHDGRRAVRPTPKQRAMAAEQQKRDADVAHRWLRGAALVVANPLLVGVVTAINWLFPPPYPQKIFWKMPEAEAWADAQLRGTAVDPPPRAMP
ncbi:MAG: hypothetical protein JWN44_945 [Myxococcales bacterium]|nr:hypothetical protein [Myxococcales bacterium]